MIGASLGPGMEFFMRAAPLGVFIGRDEIPIQTDEAIRHQLTLRADIMFEIEPQGRA